MPKPWEVQQPQPSIPFQQTPLQNTDQAHTAMETRRIPGQIQGDALSNARTARTLRQTPISNEDAAIIQGLRERAADLPAVIDDAHNAAKIIDRFGTGPTHAATVKSAITPPNAGWSDTIIPRLMQHINGVGDQSIADYQALSRYANQDVLAKQIAQKGPQTEGDAVRMLMTGISPDKDPKVNAKIVADAIFRGKMAMQKPDFYMRWANKNGSLNALDNGKTVDQAWNDFIGQRTSSYNADPRIQSVMGLKNAPRKNQAGGAKFLGFEGQ